MLKDHKKQLLLSSAATLLPVLVGLLLWNRLPARMTTHWGADGNADGWSSRTVAVFVVPLILLAVQWLCVLITTWDPQNREQNRKVFRMVLWIMPMVSFFTCGITYAVALGKTFHMDTITLLMIGLMFVIIGNYLPKCKQNRTIGIKVKWTLANEENWNVTHRLCGKLWVAGGLLMMTCIFLPTGIIPWALVLLLTMLAVAPVIYSYTYYQKQIKAGTAPEKVPSFLSGWEKRFTVGTLIFCGVLLAGCVFICFTGNIEVQYGDTAFTIEASYWDDLTVDYAAIEKVEYRDGFTPGSRIWGFGSPQLSMGNFENEEFGNYTLYAYTQCDACVVLTVGGKTLALGGKDAESTTVIYQELLQRQ